MTMNKRRTVKVQAFTYERCSHGQNALDQRIEWIAFSHQVPNHQGNIQKEERVTLCVLHGSIDDTPKQRVQMRKNRLCGALSLLFRRMM